jgi:hypothetical protein
MSETNTLVPISSIVDESIELLGLDNCLLFVELDSIEISFAVRAVKNNRFVAFRVYNYNSNDELSHLLEADEFLNHKAYQKTMVSIVNIKSTLVPEALYEETKKVALLSFNHTLNSDESVAKDDFRFFDAKNIFAVNDDCISLLEQHFSQPFFHHCSTTFIERVLLKNKNKKEIVVNANLHRQQLELAVAKDNQLLYFNSFNCQSAEDFIYYIMFMYEQLGLNPEQNILELSGILTLHSSYLTISKKYIRFVQFALRNDNKDFSYGFENLPAHQYQTLFDLSLCV